MNILAKFTEHRRRHLLAYKLLVYILICSSFFTLIATSIQLYFDYRKDIGLIEKRMKQVEESYLQAIAYSVWDFNTIQTRYLLNGVLKLQDIQYVSIEMEIKSEEVFVGIKKEEKILKYQFPLHVINSSGERNHVGELVVITDLAAIYRRLFEKVLVILGTQAFKTFIVSGFILFIIQYVVTRHLNHMALFADSLNLEHLDSNLTLNRKHQNYNNQDELDKVVSAINNMLEKLKRSSIEMKVKARMEGEFNAAAVVQQSFSPEIPQKINDFEIASSFFPAREISGDYYDFIRINERYIALIIADVSGKGISAALYANIARVLLRDKVRLLKNPIDLLSSLNSSLTQEFHAQHFLTLCYLLLDLNESKMYYANAGHEPFVLVKSESENYTLLKPKGYPFCELHSDRFDTRLQQGSYEIKTGDLVFCYTDGLTDTMNETGEMFGEERLYEMVKDLRNHSAQEINDQILETIMSFKGSAEQVDDITMLILKRV